MSGIFDFRAPTPWCLRKAGDGDGSRFVSLQHSMLLLKALILFFPIDIAGLFIAEAGSIAFSFYLINRIDCSTSSMTVPHETTETFVLIPIYR